VPPLRFSVGIHQLVKGCLITVYVSRKQQTSILQDYCSNVTVVLIASDVGVVLGGFCVSEIKTFPLCSSQSM